MDGGASSWETRVLGRQGKSNTECVCSQANLLEFSQVIFMTQVIN